MGRLREVVQNPWAQVRELLANSISTAAKRERTLATEMSAIFSSLMNATAAVVR